MESSRRKPLLTRAEIDALRRHVKSLPYDKKPTPETLEQLEKGKAMIESARATKH